MRLKSVLPLALLILFALALLAVPSSAQAGNAISVSFSAWDHDSSRQYNKDYRVTSRRYDRGHDRHYDRHYNRGHDSRYERNRPHDKRKWKRAYRRDYWGPWVRMIFRPLPYGYRGFRPNHRHNDRHCR